MTNEQLVARIGAGENEAENMLQLWKNNKNFIYKMAMKYQEHAELEDLMQEGYIGLCKAVMHYDADQGAQFISYAAFWIKQTMVRYVENCCRVVRVPSHTSQSLIKYKKIYSEYRKLYGKAPADQEMCSLMAIDLEKIQELKRTFGVLKMRSFSEAIGGDDEELLLEDTIASDQNLEEDTAKIIDTAAMQKELWRIVDELPTEQSQVIRKRYQGNKTRLEVAAEMGIDGNRVQNMEAKAMRELRKPSKSSRVKGYYEEYIAAAHVIHVGVAAFERTWTSSVERQLGL